MSYIVVFRSKSTTGQPGIMTWTCYESREKFLTKLERYLEHADVVGVGLTDDEAIALTTETHPFYYYYAALAQSYDKKSGEFYMERFKSKCRQAHFLKGLSCPDSILECALVLEKDAISVVPPIESFFTN